MKFLKPSLLVLFVIAVGLLVFAPVIPQLSAFDSTLGRMVFTSAAAPGDRFSMSYTHSVNKSRVTDLFTITDDYEIMVSRTSFYSYGAGIPEPEANTTQTLKVYDDRIDIENIDRILTPYRFFTGTTAEHTFTALDSPLRVKGETLPIGIPVPLNDYTAPQTAMILSVEKISLIAFLISALKFL